MEPICSDDFLRSLCFYPVISISLETFSDMEAHSAIHNDSIKVRMTLSENW